MVEDGVDSGERVLVEGVGEVMGVVEKDICGLGEKMVACAELSWGGREVP